MPVWFVKLVSLRTEFISLHRKVTQTPRELEISYESSINTLGGSN